MIATSGRMHVVCAWCNAAMGTVPCVPQQDGLTSHGICQDCAKRQFGDITDESFAAEAVFIDLTGRRAS